MSFVEKVLTLALLCAVFSASPPAWADWASGGVPLCTATGSQSECRIASDGAGGAIVAWMDMRSGANYDIYARLVGAVGAVAWTADGVVISAAAQGQSYPVVISDGSGGAVIAWMDNRTGNYDIYAQRVNASGAVQWTADGVAVCAAAWDQMYPKIASDGTGGAIITWHDSRAGNWDVYAQRVNASGVAQWTANGVALGTGSALQDTPDIVSDGGGGAIIAWEDYRSGGGDIYAQRVNASGAVQWTANGVALSAASGNQQYPHLVPDGVGGAIATWTDSRSGASHIYAQRVNASGAVQWTADGVAVCTTAPGQSDPVIASDGLGGAVFAWYDSRTGSADIYAQRVNSSGAVLWTPAGVPVCTAAGSQYYQQIVSDGSGGAIVTWYDTRSGTHSDNYAQRMNASGAVQWTADGVLLCTSGKSQADPRIVSDGAGGAIVAWPDMRTGEADIYAQMIDRFGRVASYTPLINAARDVPGDQGGKVYLSWYPALADRLNDPQMSYYSIWRAIDATGTARALTSGGALLDDLSKLVVSSGRPVIRVETAGGRTFFWELMETVGAYHLAGYGKPVATLFDSTAACREYTYFQVIAHTTDPLVYWISDPDSGYSVDNLPPPAPRTVAARQSFDPVGMQLKWTRSVAADFNRYAVYRGTDPRFEPGFKSLIATPYDTLYFDPDWRWNEGYYYKVSALDIHGTESGFAVFAPDDVTGIDTPKAPAASYLSQNFPNPFNPMTRIAYGLSAPGHVSLKIYDAAGRLVRTLVNEERPAGRYEAPWNGRDSSGRAVASGIYFYRLAAGTFEQTKKMALMR